MRIWNGPDPFAKLPQKIFFNDGKTLHAFGNIDASDDFLTISKMEDPTMLLCCTLLIEENRFPGCLHKFVNPKFCALEYIQSGDIFFRQNGICYIAEAGDAYLMRPAACNEILTGPSGGCRKFSASIQGPLLGDVLERTGLNRTNVITLRDKGVRIENCFERLEHAMRNNTVAAREKISGLCLELMEIAAHGEIAELESSEFAQIREAMERHISEPLTLSLISRELGMSNSTLTRKCRLASNMTPGQFLIMLRMEKASSLLVETNMRIKEIAASVGYDNPLNFSTAFHAFSGLPPRQFRNQKMIP